MEVTERGLGLLQAGLFSGDTGMIQEALAAHKQYMEEVKGNLVRHLKIDTHYYDAYFEAHGPGIYL